MREEIEQYLRLERDNLRDEVVPQLQTRIDGLENEATTSQTLTYEHTRMQQELQASERRKSNLAQREENANGHAATAGTI